MPMGMAASQGGLGDGATSARRRGANAHHGVVAWSRVRAAALALAVEGSLAPRAAATSTEPPNINSEDTDGSVTLTVWTLLWFFIVALCLGVAAYAIWRYQRQCDERDEEENVTESFGGNANAVEEWLFMSKGKQKGPVSNAFMRGLMDQGKVDRSTQAKVEWWNSDFAPIGVLFPEAGTEFYVPAHVPEAKEAQKGDWHRKSAHHSVKFEAVPSIGEKKWFYIGPDEKVHGPFANGKMRHWYMEEFFLATTLIRAEDDAADTWSPIWEIFPEPLRAFATVARKSRAARSRVGTADAGPQVIGNKSEAAMVQLQMSACHSGVIEVESEPANSPIMGEELSPSQPKRKSALSADPKTNTRRTKSPPPRKTGAGRSTVPEESVPLRESQGEAIVEGAQVRPTLSTE